MKQKNIYKQTIIPYNSAAQWLKELQEENLKKFYESQWPNAQQEEWRRTNLKNYPIDTFAGDPDISSVNRTTDFFMNKNHRYSAVFNLNNQKKSTLLINKQYSNDFSIYPFFNQNDFDQFETANNHLYQEIKNIIQTQAHYADNKMTQWHYANFYPILLVHIKKNSHLNKPIAIHCNLDKKSSHFFPQIIIIAESSSQSEIIIHIKNSTQKKSIINSTVHTKLRENANLKLIHYQDINKNSFYFNHLTSEQEKNSQLQSYELLFGSRLTKTKSMINLDGEGADANINGLYFTKNNQHFDVTTQQRHLKPRANSRAYYKGIAKDQSYAVYQGLIYVSPWAEKTDAYLTNKNLLLNSGARTDSIPCLNILTNDVKCSHGSTTGKLNEEEIFYLQSRGFSRQEARMILIEAFFVDILKQIPNWMHKDILNKVQKSLQDS